MKVGNPEATAPLNGVGTARTGTPAGKSADKAEASKAGAESSVQVELSATAANLLGGAQASDIDAAKVERISREIADGTFKVNPEAIADKLLANAQELLGRVQPK